MDVAEFVDMVMPGIGEQCDADGCTEWSHHHCSDGTNNCEEHCQCEYDIQGFFTAEYGWETVASEVGEEAALKQLACYRSNDTLHAYRMVKAGES